MADDRGRLRRSLKRAGSTAASRLWSGAARALRPALGARCGPIEPKERVLAISPHPDDEVIGCGGALLQHAELGDQTSVLTMTDGRDSKAAGVSQEETARLRRAEAENAARVLKLQDLIWTGMPERGWEPQEGAAHIDAALTRAQPEVIYAPSRIDGHPVHFKVAQALALALQTRPVPQVRIYQAQILLTPVLVNRAFDISSVWPALQTAFAQYSSQQGAISRMLRLKRYEGKLHGAKIAAEVFWEMSSAQYCALHEEPVELWGSDAFFGPKEGAFRDPLAYLQGLKVRRALRYRALRK